MSNVERALDALARGHEVEAVDILVDHFDGLFLAGDFEAATRDLAALDPNRLPPKVITAILMITAHARDRLGTGRSAFIERASAALVETWKLGAEALAAIETRLG